MIRRHAIAWALAILFTGCALDGITPGDWSGADARWYSVGDRLDCPATMYLCKAHGPYQWRDPLLDVTPDGLGTPWAMVVMITCPLSQAEGILGELPYGRQVFAEWGYGSGQETRRAVWQREYHRDAAGNLLEPLEWHIVRASPPIPYARIIIHAIEPGRARIELRPWK